LKKANAPFDKPVLSNVEGLRVSGKVLFALTQVEARQRGAKGLYISATPSEHTIGFYLHMGCQVSSEPDPELLELEPEDIHLEHALA
jgi:hypothetical protein